MLAYLEDSEDLKVGVTELQEKRGISAEAGISIKHIAQQARNEKGQKLFETFRQEENEVYIMYENGQKIFEFFRQGEEEACIASRARWNAQSKRFG